MNELLDGGSTPPSSTNFHKEGGSLVKHADACERSSPFNASAPLVLKLRKSNLYIGLEKCSKKYRVYRLYLS